MKIDPKDYKDLVDNTPARHQRMDGKIRVINGKWWDNDTKSKKHVVFSFIGGSILLWADFHKDSEKSRVVRDYINTSVTDLETIEDEAKFQLPDELGDFIEAHPEFGEGNVMAYKDKDPEIRTISGDPKPTKPRTIRDVEVGDIIYNTANHSKWVVDKIKTDGIEASYVNSNSSDLSFELLESTYSLSDTITIFEKKYTADEVREKLKDLKEVE